MKAQHTELKPCPFCGSALKIRTGVNGYGVCPTEGCVGARQIVPFDDPRQVVAWNRRATERDARQQTVSGWCAMSFGVGAASSLPQRAVRLLEEVIEAYQAAGGDPAMAHKLIDFVFDRPVGELNKEIGAVGLVLLSLANAAGVSADEEEAREVARVLAKPPSHWAARNADKNAAGFDTSNASGKP